jgi:hypothetical protein
VEVGRGKSAREAFEKLLVIQYVRHTGPDAVERLINKFVKDIDYTALG